MVFDSKTNFCEYPKKALPGRWADQDDCGRPQPGGCLSNNYSPNTCDITKYFKCQSDGSIEELACRSGLVFVPLKNLCEFPYVENCSSRENCGQYECEFVNQLIPNTCDCTQYYECLEDGSGTITFDCVDGLVFDPVQGVCEYPDLAPPGICS